MAGGAWVLRRAAASDRPITPYRLRLWVTEIRNSLETARDARRAVADSRSPATQIATKGGRHRDVAGSRRRGQCYFHDAIDALLLDGVVATRTGRLLRLVPDARIKTESQHEGVLRAEPHDGRANGRGRRRARQRLGYT